jgi:hypothetical protein
VPFALVLVLQGIVLLACAAAIVALARERGTSSTIGFALLATLVCTAILVWVTRSVLAGLELPPEVIRRIALADLSYTAVPIAAVTITALLLARRQPRPAVLSHWASAVIGLLVWSITVALSGGMGLDMINAVA